MNQHSMEVDPNGSSMDVVAEMQLAPPPPSPAVPTMQSIQRGVYHQQIFLDCATDLWQTPPIPIATDDVKHMRSPQACYYYACTILEARWRCSPADCLPGQLRASTPYSLAMMLQLARLAQRAHDGREQAHRLLLEHWGARQRREVDRHAHFEGGLVVLVPQNVSGTRGQTYRKHAEVEIVENIRGLRLCDVHSAWTEADYAVTCNDPASVGLVPPDAIRELQRKQRLDRRRDRRERRKQEGESKGKNRLPSTCPIPTKAGTTASMQIDEQLTQIDQPSTQNGSGEYNDALHTFDHAAQLEPRKQRLSKHERRTESELANQFGESVATEDVDWRTKRGREILDKNLVRRVIKGLRRCPRNNRMPLERMEFGSMRPLPPTSSSSTTNNNTDEAKRTRHAASAETTQADQTPSGQLAASFAGLNLTKQRPLPEFMTGAKLYPRR